MVNFGLGKLLSPEMQTDLEQRLEKRLGRVSCVRHPPAIDDVRVSQGEKNETVIAVSACCELTSRRAKIVVNEVLRELAPVGEFGGIKES